MKRTAGVIQQARELMEGTIDIHAHTAPSMFPRDYHDFDLVADAIRMKYRGVLLKVHEVPSVLRAAVVQEHFENQIDVWGGVVLNHYVGGFNPYVVDMVGACGGKMVWMPTLSAQHHYDYYGAPEYNHLQMEKKQIYPEKGLSIWDENHEILPEVIQVLEQVAEHDMCLGTGHLYNDEIDALVDKALEIGVTKIAVTHADFELTAMPLEQQIRLAKKGVYIEKSALPMFPTWQSIDATKTAESIRAIGAEQCVMETDFGTCCHPSHIEGMEIFIICMLEAGITPEEIKTMVATNPQKLMGVYEG